MSPEVCSCGVPWKDIDDRCARCRKLISASRLLDLPLHREPSEIESCKCSETVISSWGSRSTNVEGTYLCNFCDMRAESLKTPVNEETDTPTPPAFEPPQVVNVPISNRTAKQNLEIVESLLNNLTATKKYKRAISGGEFALFSFIGTNDWEDYASLSIDALQLLTLAQINENLEAIRKKFEES